MTSDDLRAQLAALGLITLEEAQRRWGRQNLRQNSADHPPRVRLAGGRDWLTTTYAMRAVYGPELVEVMAVADELTDGGRNDPAAWGETE